jgi:N-methylhydantoinase A/oxoprolinase/acetone carboxylase beta subunit
VVESLAIGIDIGATFTDIAMVSTAGEVHALDHTGKARSPGPDI